MLADTRNMEPYRTSMMLDHDADRPMEVESIVGEPVEAAEASGLSVPEMRELLKRLRELNSSSGGVVKTG